MMALYVNISSMTFGSGKISISNLRGIKTVLHFDQLLLLLPEQDSNDVQRNASMGTSAKFSPEDHGCRFEFQLAGH